MDRQKINDIEKSYPMDTIITETVIICTKERRGNGIHSDPIRVITEIYSMDGKKIAEVDPEDYDQ